MKILQLIPTLDRGGAERQFINLCVGLRRRGHCVHAILLTRTSDQEDELQQAGVEVSLIGKHGKLDPFAFWKLCCEIRRFRPDVLHSWLFAGNCYGRAAGRICRVEHIFANERCVDFWKSGWQFALDRILAQSCDAITTNSEAVASFYRDHGVNQAPWRVIPNGINMDRLVLKAGQEGRAAFLARLNLPEDAKIVGCVARLWPQKRLKWAIWSLDVLRRVYKKAHLLILGDGPQRETLQRFSELYELNDFVHFLGVRDDTESFLRHLDALWLTSLYEGQPNAVLEAMAMGTPTVCARIPGMETIVEHETNGFLVDQNDITGFARWTHQMWSDPQKEARIRENSRRTIERQFRLDAMVDAYEQLYVQRMQDGAERS